MASNVDGPTSDEFLQEAELTVATVLMKLKQLKPTGMTFRVRYRFAADGETHEQEVEVSAEFFNRVDSGTKLNIGVLAGDPESVRILSIAD